jgi:ATP-dependent Clp protease ATP-binding subunit ClpB
MPARTWLRQFGRNMQPDFANKIQPTDAMNTADENKEVISKLQNLEGHLRNRIRGQDQALTRIVSVLQRGELNLTKGIRPRGSFLFLGPTGVGKTEVTLAFTEFLMGKDRLFRFDMSEYQNQASLAVLIGGELGERGTLAMACDRSSYGTLLFDEIEKAHSRVMDLFLQILDAARVTMASGETLNLSGFYVVLTSNIASAEIVACSIPRFPRWSGTSSDTRNSRCAPSFTHASPRSSFSTNSLTTCNSTSRNCCSRRNSISCVATATNSWPIHPCCRSSCDVDSIPGSVRVRCAMRLRNPSEMPSLVSC